MAGDERGPVKGPGSKEKAESILRELPSVVGAFVREDVSGQPREIHLLVRPGPEPRHLARDVRSLLEERLGVPIDQRIISIAQLARDPAAASLKEEEAARAEASAALEPPAEWRLRFEACESRVSGGRVHVRVELVEGEERYVGEASELDAGAGRMRAGAAAALEAAVVACSGRARFALEGAAIVQTADRAYVLVTATVTAPALGRRSISLTGAQALDDEAETAAALAALKSANRVLGLIRETDDAQPVSAGPRLRRR